MVEMLGVLAVMRALSIGAVMGFNYGMNKHRANQVLSDIRLIYQETRIPSVMHNIVNNNSLPENLEIEQQSAYEYSFSFPDLDDFIYDSSEGVEHNLLSVNVENVPQGVCDILLQNKPSYVLMLKVNGKSVWSCDADTNEMNYVFEASSDSLEVGTCSICTDSHCFDDDFNCPEGESCYNDTCSKCPYGYTRQVDKNGEETCIDCNKLIRNTNVSEADCYRCKGTVWEYRYNTGAPDQYFKCGSDPIAITKEFCQERCGHIDGMMHANGYCFQCKDFSYFANMSKTECEKVMKCNENVIFYPKDSQGKDTIGLCTSCSHKWTAVKGYANLNKTACTCNDGYFWMFFDSAHSYCQPCTFEGGNWAPKVECDKCPNRYYNVVKGGNDRNGRCPLCPDGQVKDTSPEGDGRRCIEAS